MGFGKLSKGVKSNKNEKGGFAKVSIGMGLLLFSLLSLLCLITGDVIFYTIGASVRGFFLGLFGYFSFAVIGLIVLLGLRLLFDRSVLSDDARRIVTYLLICAFLVMAIVQTALSYDRALSFKQNFSLCYGKGSADFTDCTLLGACSMLIINPLGSIIGSAGCYVLFSLSIVILLCAAFRKQIVKLFKNVKKPAKVGKKDTKDVDEAEVSSDEDSSSESSGLPFYVMNEEFKMKTKRDYAREGRQIDIMAGNFGTRNQGGKVSANSSYSDSYKKNLSKEAEYIMTPPPLRPEDIGQSPTKATNPSQKVDDRHENAPDFDNFALSGAVYTFPTGNHSGGEAQTGARSARDPRGGLFDRRESPSGSDSFSERGSADTDLERNFGRASSQRGGNGISGNGFGGSVSQGVERSFARGGSQSADRSGGFNRDIEDRLGVSRGKQQTAEDSIRSSEADDIFAGSKDDFSNAERGGFSHKERVFDSERELTKSNVPDFNKADDIANDDIADNDERSVGFGGRATRSVTDRSVTDNKTFVGNGERSARTAPSTTATFEYQEPSAPYGSDTNAADFSYEAPSTNEFDPNEGYYSIEEMPINYRYVKPNLDLLNSVVVDQNKVFKERERLRGLAELVQANFEKRGVKITLEDIVFGMSTTRFEYSMPIDTSVKSFSQNQADIAVWLHAKGEIRIIAPIPGTSRVGIEVPNGVRTNVALKEMIASPQFRKIVPGDIFIPIGKNVMGEPIFKDLTEMPHLLVAGATGTGKSVFLNSMLVTLLYTYSPQDLRIVIVDPKQLEFVNFQGVPHLMFNKIITKADEAAALLRSIVTEMDRRYTLFSNARVKKISAYNQAIDKRVTKKLPYIIVLIDEFADLMSQNELAKKDIEASIQRLAQLARAAGISLIFATQRPTTDVIDGTIKNNFPARICFQTADYTNSQVVLGEAGAEKLLGKGDLLYKIGGPMERAQGAYLSDEEIVNVVSYIIQNNTCYYDKKMFEYVQKMAKTFGQTQSGDRDHEQMSMDLGETGNPADMPVIYRRAVRAVITQKTTSKSMLQTKLGIGYNKAARIIDWMESQGFISCVTDNKQREIRIDKPTYEQVFGEPFNEDITK